MRNYLFALASLIIIVPLLHILPLGFSRKGKFIIIATSFSLATLGLLANTILGLWQIALLILTLVIISSFLLDRKIHHLLFVEQVDGIEKSVVISDYLSKDHLQDNLNKVDDQNKLSVESEVLEEKVLYSEGEVVAFHNEQTINFDHDSHIAVQTDNETSNDEEVEEITKEADVEPLALLEENDELEQLLEISSINLEQEEIVEDTVEATIEIENDADLDYMSELEKLIFDSSDDIVCSNDHAELENDQDAFVSIEVSEGINVDDDEYLKELSQFVNIEDDVTSLVSQHNDEIASKDLEENLLSQFESVMSEVAIADEDEGGENEISDDQYVEELSGDALVGEPNVHSEIESLFAEERNARDNLQRKMFKTLLAQTELARKTFTPNQYEQMLLECMHPKMSNTEYYTFASLLIQHYISTKDYFKLEEMLVTLKDKYRKYPVIMQELCFYKRIVQKTDENQVK